MAQKTTVLRSKLKPSVLTKCGEIEIDDSSTNAYIFCAFCDRNGIDDKYFTTLQEFTDHIRWHRSGDSDVPVFENGFEEQENGSQSTLGAELPIEGAEFSTDWITPPDELIESINSYIDLDLQESGAKSTQQQDDVEEENTSSTECEIPELTGEVFIDLLDLYKKCPCVWHEQVASATSPDIINAVYKLLMAHYNKCSEQTRSEEYVRQILIQIKHCFLEEFKEDRQDEQNDILPWYYPYLSFLLEHDSIELNMSVFLDFTCPICELELTSQDDLWYHIVELHLELPRCSGTNRNIVDDLDRSPSNKTSVCEYPAEIVDKFTELYRLQTCLWDKNDKDYYSRTLRRQSYDLLLDILREHNPKATYADVGSKINHLRNESADSKQEVQSIENGSVQPSNQVQNIVENITIRKNLNPPPKLKVKAANLKKKIKTGKCRICSISFVEHSAWLSHMESVHSSEEYQSADGFFYCVVCGWKNNTKKMLILHMRNNHTTTLRKCSDCSMRFRLLSMLIDHRVKVHDDFNPFKCGVCGEGFPSRLNLREHGATHKGTEERSNWCIQCGSKFADSRSYRAHVRRHKYDKRVLICKFCQKKFKTTLELRKHMRTHLNLFTHKCDKCGKCFQFAQHLVKHIDSVHNEINSSNHKGRNLRKKQAAKPSSPLENQLHIICDECGARFFRKSSLQKHKRLKHDKTNSAS